MTPNVLALESEKCDQKTKDIMRSHRLHTTARPANRNQRKRETVHTHESSTNKNGPENGSSAAMIRCSEMEHASRQQQMREPMAFRIGESRTTIRHRETPH